MHRNRARFVPRFEPEPPPAPRACEAPECQCAGEYRAPKSRDRLNEYRWFCLDHVREYNKAWDYYAGMSEREIERHLRFDTTWQRPTWPMGFWSTREKALYEEATRQYGDFAGSGRQSYRERGTEPPQRRARGVDEDALAVLDLDPPVDFARIKAKYRELVKLHHPDANGGDKQAEERLKRINQAYNSLKTSYGV
ncbi:MAG TPA: J domain-containing protein [Arenibaculum sp.]|nr:J domain-containing protein [Arenibaculum sp.]